METATSMGVNPGTTLTLTGLSDPGPKLLSPSCSVVPIPQHFVALSIIAHPWVSPMSIHLLLDPPSNMPRVVIY